MSISQQNSQINKCSNSPILHTIENRQAETIKLLYITSSTDAPFRYRCYNYQQFLRKHEQIANIEELNELSYLKINGYSAIVLFRLPWNKDVEKIIDSAKKQNIPVVFDIDDYIFNPNEITELPFFNNISGADQINYRIKSEKLWKTFSACDFFFGSTEELVELGQELGKESFLLPNLINPELLRYSKIKQNFFKKSYNTPIISYLSGSNTHDIDFQKISSVVYRILEEHLDAHFLVVGFLRLEENFRKFEKRIIRLPFINWKLLPWIQSLSWANLSPLSEVSKFTNSKSALKFFEAAAAKVPTIATPTREMRKCIVNGENGFLAKNEDEWANAISFCLNKQNSLNLGIKAYNSSLSLFSFEANSENILSIFKKITRPTSNILQNNKFSIDQIDLKQDNYSSWEILKHKARLTKYLTSTAIKNIIFSTPQSLGLKNSIESNYPDYSKPLAKFSIDPKIFKIENSEDITLDNPPHPKWKDYANLQLIDEDKRIFASLGEDPYFQNIILPAKVMNKDYFFLRMVCRAEEKISLAQIFWLSDLNDTYQEEFSLEFPVLCDGETHTYLVNLTELRNKKNTLWKSANNIYKMRLDPLSCKGTFKILEMKFTDITG